MRGSQNGKPVIIHDIFRSVPLLYAALRITSRLRRQLTLAAGIFTNRQLTEGPLDTTSVTDRHRASLPPPIIFVPYPTSSVY